ncbi:MAG: hypothetical protein NZ482_06505 [Gloeomargarita sp. SKYG98]|nr:hypothetical protein [Gloeomargarita sp. SKYG98]
MHRQRRRSLAQVEELNIWMSFTDLMSGSLLIFSLLLFLLVGSLHQSRNNIGQQSDEVPPIIVIPDNEAFRFPVGSAELSSALRQYIWEDLVEKIIANRRRFGIDTIEIIGHTDGQPNRGARSNLDMLLEVSAATNTLQRLTPGSNVDLGLMRALAIANELHKIQAQRPELEELKGLNFRAYSAGQLYLPTGEIAPPDRSNDSSRRRIEVRFTRLGRVEKAVSQ